MTRLRADPAVAAHSGELVVERDPARPTGRLLRQDDMDASYVDLADPRHLEFDYLRWMRIVLREVNARRVLHIGGGGCALPRALATEDPGSRQEVCEVDGEVLAIARKHLGLRRMPGLRVRHADGRAFIAGRRDAHWDAVVIDAFVGAAIPGHLVTVEAARELAGVTPLVLVNVVDNRAARHVHAVAASLALAYPRVWTLSGRAGNTVVVAAVRADGLERIGAAAAADPSPATLTAPDDLADVIVATPAPRDAVPEPPTATRIVPPAPGDALPEPPSADAIVD